MFSVERIRTLIENHLPDCTAIVEDPADDGAHFEARVMSPAFEGKSRVACHRLVYEALGEHMGREIHALTFRTFTPDTWQS